MNRTSSATASALLLLSAALWAPSSIAWADSSDSFSGNTFGVSPGPDSEPVSAEQENPVRDACRQFGAALDLAASNYEDFAYATAGNGDSVNYQNPEVSSSNVLGRTALREAAWSALSASRLPGLPPEVSDPMAAWSLHATKLVLFMGLHGGGNSLNSSADQLNTDAHDVQMACATDGGHA